MHMDHLRVVQGAQGSLGVMTWAAVYCERIPTLETAWFASAEALEPVINLARDLLHRRLGNALFIVDRVQLALLLARDESQFRELSRTLPPWTLFVSLSAGREKPAEKMAWQSADLNLCASQHGVRLADALQGTSAQELNRQLHTAEPTSFRDRALGAHRELFFLQQLDRASEFVNIVGKTVADAHTTALPLGVYIQPMTQGVNCHIEFTLPYQPGDAKNDAPMASTWQAAAIKCASHGGFFSRPYGRWAEFAYEGASGTLALMNMTKSIFDPNGVMNPGRLPYQPVK